MVPTMPTCELYMAPKSNSSRESNPRTGRLKTTALAIGLSVSVTSFPAPLIDGERSPGGGGGASEQSGNAAEAWIPSP